MTSYFSTFVNPSISSTSTSSMIYDTLERYVGCDVVAYRDNDAVVLEVELPGVKKENVSLHTNGKHVLVRYKSRTTGNDLERKILIGFDPESVDASMSDGLLVVKCSTKANSSKSIEVK